MLATLVDEPFDDPGWIYEEKYDGYRILAYKEGNRLELLSRNRNNRAERFAHIAAAIRKLRHTNLLLDGEVVVFNREGLSKFQLLQGGIKHSVYVAFDCLYLEGHDLRKEPLSKRRKVMEDAIGSSEILKPSRILSPDGIEAYELAREKGYEGVVAKDYSSPYVEGRSRSWLKIKVHQMDEFVIVGYTVPGGARKNFGALLLGAYRNGRLHYTGKVGSGFGRENLSAVYEKLQPLVRKHLELENPPQGKGITFVTPRLVAQISYQEWTADNKLRQPVFLGLRDDKSPKEVKLPDLP
jgi:bifunctional non-homologous end joining protein LigD